jgi:hypothetical protein
MSWSRVAGILGLAVLSSSVLAWKPTTHVYLAEAALADALDDGKVSIFRVDYANGKILEKLGDYPVDPELLRCIRENREQFRSGVLGPDAYPDILTGQSAIHPGLDPQTGGKRGDDPNEGADAWLTYLWKSSRKENSAVRAWTAGFMTHAAGDLFAHTFINEFAGGEFLVGPNAMRHVVLEGYLDKRCQPVADFHIKLDGATTFISDKLCRVEPGSELDKLLVGEGAKNSPIRMFGDLRAQLMTERLAYDKMSFGDQAAYNLAHPGRMQYIRAWIRDIDSGLKAWPEFSQKLAVQLMFSPEGMNKERAKAEVKKFADAHLLSMLGLPDAAGAARQMFEAISVAILTPEMRKQIADYERAFLDNICLQTFGYPLDYLETRVKNPENYFDEILGPGSDGAPTARRITLRDFNEQVLGIQDESFTKTELKWDWHTFAPAYNTVTLTKFSLMSPETVNQVMHDLKPGGPTLAAGSNVLLGYQNSLDNDNQWHANHGKLVFVRAAVYEQLFMKQIGERPAP